MLHLRELEISTSNFYENEDKNILRESQWISFAIHRSVKKSVLSIARKIVINIRSENYSGPNLERVSFDDIDKVLVVEVGFDISKYNECQNTPGRIKMIFDLIREEVLELSIDTLPGNNALVRILNDIEENGIYEEEIGSRIWNKSRSHSAQLKIFFDSSEIKIFACLIELGSEQSRDILIGIFHPSDSILEQLGKLSFSGNRSLKYTPKKYFDPIIVDY